MHFHPLKIGRLTLASNVVAAPMAGLATLPFRIMAIEEGCALAFSELVSAEGLVRAAERTRRYLANDAAARPFGVQLFGASPASIAEAIRRLDDIEADLIDINMGCPVRKVCSSGAGAALMLSAGKAAAVVAAARAATRRPLTVKMRSGWDESSINCAEIAQAAEGEGADAIIVHARTRIQGFSGRADWRRIAEAKGAVAIPVIGNGDVRDRDGAIRMIEETGCDGVMIGRAAVGNPWVFGEILGLRAGPPSPAERAAALIRHVDGLIALMGEKRGLMAARAVLPWYGKGIKGVKAFLQRAHLAKGAEELKEEIRLFFSA